MELPHIESLRGGATAAIIAADLDLKTALAQETARRWFANSSRADQARGRSVGTARS